MDSICCSISYFHRDHILTQPAIRTIELLQDFSGNSYNLADDIIRDVDIAMYEAKMDGKACHVIFDPKMRDQAAGRLKMKADLQKALTYESFF
jgi:hypothetical protein